MIKLTIFRDRYIAPALAILEAESEGVLCGSINGIDDLDYYYDETEKE